MELRSSSLEITPPPSEAERFAIAVALERLLTTGEARTPGAWWEEGLRENLAADGEPPEAISKRGD